eukprot:357494-Chlamydomonas_euryale.AAC.7
MTGIPTDSTYLTRASGHSRHFQVLKPRVIFNPPPLSIFNPTTPESFSKPEPRGHITRTLTRTSTGVEDDARALARVTPQAPEEEKRGRGGARVHPPR